VPEDAFELAVAALGRKERSAAELAEWLRRRGVEEIEIEAALERLRALGEIDDERFARRFAEDKRELAGWGAERIREVLVARGVALEHAEAAVADDGHGEQVGRAVGLLSRRGGRLETDAERARALAYLTRRGYGYEIAYEAVRQAGRAAA
jgi:regulatory protein